VRSAPKLDEVLERVERRLVELALRKTKGDQTAAADFLGVYRSRLVRRVKALGLGDGE
jgi:DNA-binding NtrC family response regulator